MGVAINKSSISKLMIVVECQSTICQNKFAVKETYYRGMSTFNCLWNVLCTRYKGLTLPLFIMLHKT